ncbi:hypothetical protein F994_00007 [Acinetobacter bohemicus ANC 3994]|uniref:Endonuclease GajA/Old nuclease/RecF-like AAA domain-containing protein n=1 Tax=Acinetobacter bohemicus ANC 3994 TaxID=1217715 RepID=N8P4W3_9GAMM|nr:AAA family ATPase [Acinetobacter bohemicus]ENU21440.1 hypothetical protein F994_00007 [Acinetobacter bohemicus ANC 3994]
MSLSLVKNSSSKINILIGENGQGKTRILDSIALHFKDNRKNLITINNPRGKNLIKRSSKFLFPNHRASDLNSVVHKLLTQTFNLLEKNKYNEIENRFFKIARMLDYLGFESQIFFSVKDNILKKDFLNDDIFDGDYDESYLISSLLDYLDIKEDDSGNKYVCIDFIEDIYGETENSIKFLYLIKYYWNENIETHLINKETSLILRFNQLSSGERNIILSIFFISISLSDNKENILIIDEPEISLHPKWQIDYLDNISDLFYLHDIRIYIATHSPLILTNLFFEKEKKVDLSYTIFHVKNSNVRIVEDENEKSIEAIYWNIFGILTPQSSFLSRKITELLNKLTLGKISLDEVLSELDVYIEASHDFNQISWLEELKEKIILNNDKLQVVAKK